MNKILIIGITLILIIGIVFATTNYFNPEKGDKITFSKALELSENKESIYYGKNPFFIQKIAKPEIKNKSLSVINFNEVNN